MLTSELIIIRTALSQMGYRPIPPRQWVKPSGYHLFVYKEGDKEWTNWFKSATDKLYIWQTVSDLHTYVEGEGITSNEMKIEICIHKIQTIEAYTRHDIAPNYNNSFWLSPQMKDVYDL